VFVRVNCILGVNIKLHMIPIPTRRADFGPIRKGQKFDIAKRRDILRTHFHHSSGNPDDRFDKLTNFDTQAQYDLGRPRTFSAIKHRIICELTGAIRDIMASRR